MMSNLDEFDRPLRANCFWERVARRVLPRPFYSSCLLYTFQ